MTTWPEGEPETEAITHEDYLDIIEELDYPTNWWPRPKWVVFAIGSASAWLTAYITAGEMTTELKTTGVAAIAAALVAYIVPDRTP